MYLVTRPETFAKFFFLLSLSGLVTYAVLAFYTFHIAYSSKSARDRNQEIKKNELSMQKAEPVSSKPEKVIKYILLWTIPEVAYNLKSPGQQIFIENNCTFQNCYLTTNKEMLDKDESKFDAIVFSINTFKNWKINMPKKRSPKQKYVFYSMLPSDKFPICNVKADNFFNWTWSYKQYSDIVTPFVEVKDLNNNVISPKYDNWTTIFWNTIDVIDNSIESKNNLSGLNDTVTKGGKEKALMWYTEKCYSDSSTLTYINQLVKDMKKQNLFFGIFGCGFNQCPEEGCLKAVEKYYFYLAHEESLADDYVSTEVLKAYDHNAVPIVIGGADYIRYLPRNSFIDATYDSTERIASLIRYAIKTPATYKNFFTWKNYSKIEATELQKGYCDLCAMVNHKKMMERITVYEHFRKWWFHGSLNETCTQKGAENYDEIQEYANDGVRKKP